MAEPSTGILNDSERSEAADLLRPFFPHLSSLDELLARVPAEQSFAVRQDGRLAAVILWRRETLLAYDRPVPIAIAGPGATAPEFQGRGLLAANMAAFLASLRDSGCAVSGLETPVVRWHRGNGWEICSAVARHHGDAARFRPASGPADGSLDARPPIEALQELYRRAAARRFGPLCRTGRQWAELLASQPGLGRRSHAAWREPDGTYGGYIITTRRPDCRGAIRLTVEELITVTPNAFLGLLRYLAEHDAEAWVQWDAPQDDPLVHVVRDPHAITTSICTDKLLRVIDLAALTMPAPDDDAAARADGLTLMVDDPLAPWNAGTWRVARTMPTTQAMVRAPQPPDGKLRGAWCSVPATVLGPLLSRFLSVEAAAEAGLIRASCERALRQLRAFVGTGPAPYCPGAW